MIVMAGEIAHLLTGGAVEPLYHCVRPARDVPERLALLYFADLDPSLCEPWVRNAFNRDAAIGERVLTNPTRFGLRGFNVS